MMYDLEVKDEIDRIFHKLARKNPKQLEMIDKKFKEIRLNPQRIYKFLRYPLQGFNRFHIDTHFVLIFKVDHVRKVVILYYFDHHDGAYKWRPKPE